MKPYFISTAIDYTNALPHIGHTYEKILADVLARYHRLRGREVFFLTGVDQHGQKVQQAAERQNISPLAFTNTISEAFVTLWKKLGISYDAWASTTNPVHKSVVQQVLSNLLKNGWLYKASYKGYYSVRQEQFLTDKERGEDGEFGAEWGEVVFLEEENWYFRLSECRDWLISFLEKYPNFITPSFRHVELKNAATKINTDLCISRPKSRLSWGIEFPFDSAFVVYVWFDALINYISFAGYLSTNKENSFSTLWPCNAHVIGKDILIPAHGIYWPCMLHAMGFSDEEMPHLLVHGFWTLHGEKISKTTGNVFDVTEAINRFGVSALRYYLMRDAVMGRDADFCEERLISRYHSELSNGLGNLLNRTLGMIGRYRPEGLLSIILSEECSTLLRDHMTLVENYCRQMEASNIQAAIESMIGIITRTNIFIDATTPWQIAKHSDQANRLSSILTSLLQSTRIAATLLMPITPDAANEIFQQLALDPISLKNHFSIPSFPKKYNAQTAIPVFPRFVEKNN